MNATSLGNPLSPVALQESYKITGHQLLPHLLETLLKPQSPLSNSNTDSKELFQPIHHFISTEANTPLSKPPQSDAYFDIANLVIRFFPNSILTSQKLQKSGGNSRNWGIFCIKYLLEQNFLEGRGKRPGRHSLRERSV